MTNFPSASTDSLTTLPTLLIIEDSEVDRHTYLRYLAEEKDYQYKFVEASTLEEAFEYWQSVCPDLVIVDVNLADGNGLEFLATLKETGVESPLPVIVITGMEEKEIILQAMKLGVRDYLRKDNMTASALCRSVKSALREIYASRNLARLQQQEIILAKIALDINQLVQLEDIYHVTVSEVQSFVGSDRVLIYQFQPDQGGTIVAETVKAPWSSYLQTGENIELPDHNPGEAHPDWIFNIADIYTADLSDYHLQHLANLQVRAKLVVPIFLPKTANLSPENQTPPSAVKESELWGLFVIHQCSGPRNWEETEVHFLQRVAVQLAIAIQQNQANQQIQAQLEELCQWRKRYELAERASGQVLYESHFPTGSVIWGANAELMLGYSEATIPKSLQEWITLIHPEDHSIVLAELEKARAENRGFLAEYRFLHQQGHYIWLEDRNQWLYDQQGEKIGVIGMLADITQRKATEAQLIESEAKFQQLAIAQPGVLYTLVKKLDGSFTFSYLSPQAEQVFEQDLEVMLTVPESIFAQIHPDDFEGYNLAVEESFVNLSPFRYEFRILTPSGQEKWLEANSHPQKLATGEVAWFGIGLDVSDRLHQSQELIESETRFRQLAENIRQVFYLTDANKQQILYISPSYETIWERSCQSLYERPLSYMETVYEADRPIVVQAYEQQRLGENTEIEYRIVRRDGSLCWILDRTFLVCTPTGVVERICGIAEDISDRKEAEQALQLTSKRLQEAQRIARLGNWELDLRSNHLYWSEEVFRIFEIEPQKFIPSYEGFLATVHPHDRELVNNTYTQHLQDRFPYCITHRLLMADGRIKYVQEQCETVFTEEGNPLFSQGTIQDITEVKEAELLLQKLNQSLELTVAERTRELSEINALQQTILDGTDLSIISTNPEGLIKTFNRGSEKMLGYSAEEMIDQYSPDLFVVTEDLQQIAENLSAQLGIKVEATVKDINLKAQAVIKEQEVTYVRKDGSHFSVQLSVNPLKNDQQEIIGFLGISKDITLQKESDRQRQEAEEALRKSEMRFRRVYESDVVGMMFANFAGEVVDANDRFLEIIGYSRDELNRGLINWAAITPPEYAQLDWEAVEQLQSHGSVTPWEKVYLHKDGHPVHVLVGVASLSDSEDTGVCVAVDISDRKQGELERQTLLQELSVFKSALDQSAIVAITDAKGVITYANELFSEISGYSNEELMGQTHRIVGSGYHSRQFFQDLWHTIAAGQIWRGEVCNRAKNGNYYWLASTLIPFLDVNGKPFQYLAIRFDITARKKAEEQLQELTKRLTLALEAGEIGSWEWNLKEDTLLWDERMYSLYGLAPEKTDKITYNTWYKALHPQDREQVQQNLQAAVEAQTDYEAEFRVIHTDYSIHFIKAAGLLVRDAKGNPESMIGVNFEITQQKEAEMQLQHQAQKEILLRQITQRIRQTLDLQTNFDTACREIRQFLQVDRVAIFRFYPHSGFDDGEFVAESLNAGFSSVLAIRVNDHCFGEGYSQLYTQGRFQCVHDVMKSDLQDCHKNILRAFQIRANLVMPLLCGQELWGLLCIHTCTNSRVWQAQEIDLVKQISQQLAIAIQQADLFSQLQQELQERQQAQQQLTERNQQLDISNQELARATRLKDEFLANMSHELRTPLTAILGMSEALEENSFGELNSGQEKAVTLIEKSGRHLLELINDILDFAKIEAGKLELEFAEVSVQKICQDSLTFVKQIAFSKQISLQSQFPRTVSYIWGDERRTFQCLLNLLSNAIKFTAAGGQVTLKIEQQGQEVLISVIDTGMGIAPSDLEKLFQPFVQIDSSLNRQYEGTGLGLALVKEIVGQQGGRVSVTSTPGQGSCFTLHFPVYVQSPCSPLPREDDSTPITNLQDEETVALAAPLILLADDNEANIQTFHDYLTLKNYRLLLARNGQEAIEMTRLHQPDLILMDIQMPKIDGLEAISLIRSEAAIAKIPIIALTALALPGDNEKCLAAGANLYLAKPVRFKLLIEAIQKLLQAQKT